MRARHAILAAIVVTAAVGVKVTQMRSVQTQYIDGEQGRLSRGQDRNASDLPVQKIHDRSVVFSIDLMADGGAMK